MPILYVYVFILIGCFILARLALWGVQARLKQDFREIESTYRTWLIIVACCLIAIGLGSVTIILGLTLVAILGLHEFFRATELYDSRFYPAFAIILTVATGGIVLVSAIGDLPSGFDWFQRMPGLSLTILLLVPIFTNRSKQQLRWIAFTFFGYFYVAWMLLHLAWMASAVHGSNLLLFLLFSVGIADIAAFTCGKALGRHKLCPEISPRKTWEGLLGAILVSVAVAWLLRFSFPASTNSIQITSIGLLVGIGSQLGDLVFSMIKRDVGLKDMGKLLPGHGGVLDRIDSLIMVSPFYVFLLQQFEILEC